MRKNFTAVAILVLLFTVQLWAAITIPDVISAQNDGDTVTSASFTSAANEVLVVPVSYWEPGGAVTIADSKSNEALSGALL